MVVLPLKLDVYLRGKPQGAWHNYTCFTEVLVYCRNGEKICPLKFLAKKKLRLRVLSEDNESRALKVDSPAHAPMRDK
jgi:hypothetical protein